MTDTTFALVCLSLFSDPERAAEIEGDLLEQQRRHGRGWFWMQVVLTCIALFFHSLRADAGKVLLLSYGAYELVLKLNWWALRPLRFALWKGLDLEAAQLPMMDNSIVTLTAFSLGMLVARLSPKQGAQITLLAGGFLLGRMVIFDGLPELPRFIAFILIPGMLGVLLMKWMELRNDGPQGLQPSH